MSKKFAFLFVIVLFSQLVFAPLAHADGGPIPPVSYTCASLNGTNAYAPGVNDSTTALQAVNCPAIGKWITTKINGVTFFINKGIVAGKDIAGLSATTVKLLVKKLAKGK